VTLVKVCGLRTLADARTAVESGANLLGFIFWQPGKRYVRPTDAAQIISTLRDEGRSFEAVGVFVDPDLAEVEAAVTVCNLDQVQLSGDEPAGLVAAMPRPTVKAIHVRPGEEAAAAALVDANVLGAERYLLDTHADGLPGGTGVAFDWSALRPVGPRCLVAGGLRAENVASALSILAPLGVDVSSGVESAPGTKDPQRIRAFLEAVRTYDSHHQQQH
jgi:phosphoribosylanthranilate isomerase